MSPCESGGSSVVTRWTVDQEVVGSNPTHDGNLFLSCARSPGLLSPFDKMSTGFGSRGPPHRAGTKNMGLCPSLIDCIQ